MPGTTRPPRDRSVTANFAAREQKRVITTDREVDGDRADRSDRVDRSDRWTGAAAFALAILVASLIPVSWVVPGGAGGGNDAGGAGGTGDTGGGTGAEIIDALPFDVGLTDPFHLVGYAVLAVLASRATGRGRRGLLLAAGAAVAFGFGIELVQAPIPWRSFAWSDAAVNAMGAVVGLVAVVAVDAVDAIAAVRDRRSR